MYSITHCFGKQRLLVQQPKDNKYDGRLTIPELYDTTSYFNILQLLKEEIHNTKMRASLAINKEVTLLYWRIGKEIVRQKVEFG